jgi:Outer membrane protein beta-barrel domain
VKTTLPGVLLISLLAQISMAQTSSSAPLPSAAPSLQTSSSSSREIWVDGGWSVNSNNAIGTDQLSGGSLNDLQVTNGALVAVRFDLNQGNHIGHEFQYMNARMPIQLNYENATLDDALNRFGYNLLGYFNGRYSKVRFFGTLGGQWTNYSRPSTSEIGCESANCSENGQPPATGGNNKFGISYGVGMKVHFTRKLSLRSDFRQYVNGKPFNLPLSSGGALIQTVVSSGLGISF